MSILRLPCYFSPADRLWNTICFHNICIHCFHGIGKNTLSWIQFLKRGRSHCRQQIFCRQQMRRPVFASVVISVNNYITPSWQQTPAISCSSCNHIVTPLFISYRLWQSWLVCVYCLCCNCRLFDLTSLVGSIHKYLTPLALLYYKHILCTQYLDFGVNAAKCVA